MDMRTDSRLIANNHGWYPRSGLAQALTLIAAMLLLAASAPLRAQDKGDPNASNSADQHNGIGFKASKDASSKDVGLPWYPGARRSKDTPDDSSSVQFGFWGGSTAFQLAVLKLESNDAPGKVQAFYRNALGRYGHVVTCTASSPSSSEGDEGKSKGEKSSDQLDCGSDKLKSNETVLKAGTKNNQHLVSITASGSGSTFQLVYVLTPKSDD
jgi:hypothetical protein